jgi:hypothetical protein
MATTDETVPAAATDLMAALKASLDRAKKRRDELDARLEKFDLDQPADPS